MRVFWELRSSYFSDCALSALGLYQVLAHGETSRAFLSVDSVLSKGYFSLGLRTLPEVLGFWAPRLRRLAAWLPPILPAFLTFSGGIGVLRCHSDKTVRL